MPRIREERIGDSLLMTGRELNFSFRPVKRQTRSYVRQPEILATNPWDVIENVIRRNLNHRVRRRDALYFLWQAKDFWSAAQTAQITSKPLLLYYSMMNAAKALILYRGVAQTLNRAMHGLSEDTHLGTVRDPLLANVIAMPNKAGSANIFDLFGQAIGCAPLAQKQTYQVANLLPQIVIGHRLWAAVGRRRERFVRADSVSFAIDQANRQTWLRIDIDRSDLPTVMSSYKEFEVGCRLAPAFRRVKFRDTGSANSNHELLNEKFIRYESATPTSFITRAAERVNDLAGTLKPILWPVVRSTPPYRRYYLYASPSNAVPISPLLSVYALVYFFGSITRYRPHLFDKVRESPFGMFVDEFLNTQGRQFLFLTASELVQRDVSWPAVI